MRDGAHRILQISDIHLNADVNGELLGVKTQDSLQAVIQHIQKNQPNPDAIILSGDLSQDGSAASYERLAKMVNVLDVPIYFVPGNHDNPDNLRIVYPREKISDNRHLIFGDWQIILLDSQKPGSVEGHFRESELRFLRECLEKEPKRRAIIVFHHQPLKMDCKWLDNLGVTNAETFWQIVANYSNIHAIFFGHVHQESFHTVNNIPCYSLPSTCIQFKGLQSDFALENIPPGYRWINLHQDGRLETGVTRLTDYIGRFDETAKGY